MAKRKIRVLNLDYLKPKSQHPPKTIIYCLLQNKKIVYIGATCSLKTRIRSHRIGGKIFDHVNYIDSIRSRHDVEVLENFLISKFKPKYNKAIVWDYYKDNHAIRIYNKYL